MNKKRRLLFLIAIPFLLGAISKPYFNVIGVKGKLLKNVKSRLNELAETRPLDTETDEELKQQIAQAIQPYGYFKAQIILKRQPLEIIIIPGSQVIITQVNLKIKGEGASNAAILKALHAIPVVKDKPFISIKYEDAKQEVLSAAELQGYLHASFEKAEVLINKANNTAQITLLLDTGPQYIFGQVKFDPANISPKLLARYLPFKPGDPFSSDKILTLNSQLSDSGYFRSVAVKPQLEANGREIPVDVHFRSVPRLNYSIGAGYGTDTGPRGRAGLHIVPVNSEGHKFNLVGLGSFVQNALQAQYIVPGKNPVTDQYNITANVGKLNYDIGYSNAALISFAQQLNLPQFKRNFSVNGLFERYHYNYQTKKDKTTLFPKASYTWLQTKDKLFSPSGYNINVTALAASKAVLSEDNFVQGTINAKAALTIPSLRTRFYIHGIQSFTQINDINQLPLSLAILLGGAENLKGFNINSIGGGKIVSYGGIEIQKETVDHWYFIGFFDAGNVYSPRSEPFKYDAGLALMWVSPVGPIKVGVAQAINQDFSRYLRKTPKFFVSMGPDL